MSAVSRFQQLQEMLKSEPNDSFLNYAVALEHAKMGEIQKAIELIEVILNRDINYLGAYYQLGNYYELTKQPEKAIAIYNKGIEIATKQNNRKTQSELQEALWLLQDD
ncbi:MAG: tetratricopeptide repeat protein [Bacteroidia bacterium]